MIPLPESYERIWCFGDLNDGGASGWNGVARHPANRRGRTTMGNTTIIEFTGRDAITDPLGDLLRKGGTGASPGHCRSREGCLFRAVCGPAHIGRPCGRDAQWPSSGAGCANADRPCEREDTERRNFQAIDCLAVPACLSPNRNIVRRRSPIWPGQPASWPRARCFSRIAKQAAVSWSLRFPLWPDRRRGMRCR